MSYKYNICYFDKQKKLKKFMNFKNKLSMLKYLDKNQEKLSSLYRVILNFKAIALPLKQSVWYHKTK